MRRERRVLLVAQSPGALRDHRPGGGLLNRAGSSARRSRAANWLAVGAALLILLWGYLWIVREAHGAPVHILLLGAFVLLGGWGALRALPDRRDAGATPGPARSDDR